ncbi:MAG: hypothetical protein K2Q01_11875 [Rickettsiales bacterium]|nr:hypothetical protein [Rickettsiales bacterium]
MEQDPFDGWPPRARLSAALVTTLFMQGAGALVWATHLDARVSTVEQQSVNSVMLSEKFARLDERLEGMRRDMEAMRKQMEVIGQRLIP